jgi:hypothetical protein
MPPAASVSSERRYLPVRPEHGDRGGTAPEDAPAGQGPNEHLSATRRLLRELWRLIDAGE